MSDYATFVNLVNFLQSSENEARVQAEKTYDGIPAQNRVILHIQILSDASQDPNTKSSSAILCRRLIVDDFKAAYLNHGQEMRAQIKNGLLMSITSVSDKTVRFKISDLTAALASSIIDNEEDSETTWPEFVQFMTESAHAADPALRIIGFHLFAAVPNVFGDETANQLQAIGQMFTSGLSDENNAELRDEALKALTEFLSLHGSVNAVTASLKDLVPQIMTVIVKGLKEDENNETGLKCFLEIIEATPKFLRPMLSSILAMCFEILCNKELPDSVRQLSLTAIVLLAENLPAAVRKSGQFVEQLVNTLLSMMTEVEEEPDWESADTLDQEDEEENAVVACRSLDAIALAIGGKNVVNEIVRSVPIMLQNPDWKHRHAGLMAISYCGEGCRKQMEDMLASILQAILPLFSDPHPRVRYAACYAIAQMSSDFSPKIQKLHHAIILPPLVATLDDICPRVQANAATALIGFVETLPKAILSTYLEALVSKLEEGMSAQYQRLATTGAKMVLTQIVDAVSIVAETAEDKFIPYYSRFMPGLKVIMENCASCKKLHELRGVVVQCISIIGLAVGKDVFRQDMEPILQLLLKAQATVESVAKEASGDAAAEANSNDDLDDDDPQITYMIRAWARICKLLGSDFEPYLPIVMPQLLATARIKPEICLVDNDDADDVRGEEEWEVVKFSNEEHLAVKTSGLEDKATACEMLVCYARELKEKFAPYAVEVLDLMLPLLEFYLNDEVRVSAAEIMPDLLVCLSHSPEAVKSAWDRISEALFKAIPNETEVEAQAELLKSLGSCIDCLGKNCLTYAQLNEIHTQINRFLENHFAKDEERNERRQDEDHDKENEEAILAEKDEDEKVLSYVNELLHVLFITHCDQALTIFNSIIPHIEKLMQPDRPSSDLQWALCFWSDLIEFGGEAAWTHSERYLNTLVTSLSHTDPPVRQVACYSVGTMAQYACPQFHGLLKQLVPALLAIIDVPDSRSPDNVLGTENAISAITKIMKFHPEVLTDLGSIDELIKRWFTWLPIWEDDSETDFVYSYLCELVEQNNTALLGTTQDMQNSSLARVIAVIAECYANEGMTADGPMDSHTGMPISRRGSATLTGKGDGHLYAYYRCAALLKKIQETNSPLFEACIGQLTDDQRTSVGKVLAA